ncbi:hypothetical protein [Stenotrophomonas sp. YAU14D1_LEIMI4_1]|uniref:hypothetical protein n=1 Tax=Stenotrophomonas sp. YAU14D1_LEIMI4_1 TaxID=2072407 RepID=UPI000D53DF52|nr:hypothetical protein [Stenotrophomonas sp. YAU14D1_LEIMI4_1]AWH24014.1 hypothetical protein C1932_02185 [Stenotrophomonas sp. YAU14D1_LEIMI4_1]
MPLEFQRQPGTAVDRHTGVIITAPRILPASPPEDASHTEYQYLFHRNGQRVGGLGLFGSDEMVETESGCERVFSLDLGRDWVLRSILGFKQTLNDQDSNFVFLCSVAQGLVLANMDHSSARYGVRYVATTTAEALARNDISTVGLAPPHHGSVIILAEAVNPVRADWR